MGAIGKYEATAILSKCHVRVGGDFHTLGSATVERLLDEADLVKYRKPANANGSRGRYFHDFLQRKARGKDD